MFVQGMPASRTVRVARSTFCETHDGIQQSQRQRLGAKWPRGTAVVFAPDMRGATPSLEYSGPSRAPSPARLQLPLLLPSFWRSAITIIGLLMALFHCGLSRMILDPGPHPLRDLSSQELLIHHAWLAMIAGSVCAILRLPRLAYAACAAFAVMVLGFAAFAATRESGIGLIIYATYAITSAAGFLMLAFGRSGTTSSYEHPSIYRRHTPLPGLAFIWSVLASPVGLFWGALITFTTDFPTVSELKVLSAIFLVALPITSFAFAASVWCHLDRNRGRLEGRPLATAAWVISSFSLFVALLVAALIV